MKRIISLILSTIMLLGGVNIISASAAAAEPVTITADKTAQWIFNHSNTGADLSIHGYTDYAREAYVGFSLPANFSAADLASAKIKLYTKTAGKVGNVNIYPTDYSGFTSGQELEGDDNRLTDTGSSIKTFQSPSAKSDVEVDITDYMANLADGHTFRDSDFEINGARVVTLTYVQAKYARKLNGTLYIGNNCNLYEDSSEIICAEDGGYSYEMWNGNSFEKYGVKRDFENAVLTLEPLDKPPFELDPKYSYELHIGGERTLTWKMLSVSSDKGFIEIPDICDTAQIYADGELIADEFYYGAPWRIPARVLYKKECYLVTSEIHDDFYREF